MHIEVRKRPLEGRTYESLLRALATPAAIMGMIIRSEKVTLAPRAVDLLAALEPYLIRSEHVDEWPGTRLVGGRTSLRHLYRLTPHSLNLALEAAGGIFEWVNPNLPEDLHFLRRDGSTVFGSIAQENAVWLDIGEDELQQLLIDAPPEIRDALNSRVTGIRIMNPTTGKNTYPNGCAAYMNDAGQPVNPLTGQMIHDPSDPFAHISLS